MGKNAEQTDTKEPEPPGSTGHEPKRAPGRKTSAEPKATAAELAARREDVVRREAVGTPHPLGPVVMRDPAELNTPFAGVVRDHTPDEKGALDALIDAYGILQPLLVTDGGDVIEGRGRLRKAIALGLAEVPCVVVTDVDDEEARRLAVKLNTDRKQLTREEREQLIRDLLHNEPALSDREIAKRTRTSHATVGKKRKGLERTGQIGQSDGRRDHNGVVRPASANRRAGAKAAGAGTAGEPARPEAGRPEPDGSTEAGAAALLTGVSNAIDALGPEVDRLIGLIRAGGPGAPDRPAVAALADTLTRYAADLTGAFGPADKDDRG